MRWSEVTQDMVIWPYFRNALVYLRIEQLGDYQTQTCTEQ